MPDFANEPKYDTLTAKVFYRLRDLFLQKSSVYTAKSLKLLPAGLGLLVALAMIGLVLYRLSEPVGKERGQARATLPPAPETVKIRRESKPEEKPHWPTDEEVWRRWAGVTGPPASPARPDAYSGEIGHPFRCESGRAFRRQTGHPFRTKVATRSGRNWPPIPLEIGHRGE